MRLGWVARAFVGVPPVVLLLHPGGSRAAVMHNYRPGIVKACLELVGTPLSWLRE